MSDFRSSSGLTPVDLANSSEILSFALNRISESAYLIAADGSLVYVNDIACTTLGYSRDELLTMTVADINPGISEVLQQDLLAKIWAQGVHKLDSFHKTKDGRVFPVEVSVNACRFDGLQHSLALARDITVKREVEAELSHKNRVHRLLSGANRALVRANSERELLEDVCRLAIGVGGFDLAWVGYARDDEAKNIEVVASAGELVGVLHSMHFSWGDGGTGSGAAGVAIRTGVPAVISDTATDCRAAPLAFQVGLRSIIALPLKSDEDTYGAFVAYSRVPDAFNSEEVEILTALADDLAYGLGSLGLREDHARKKQELTEAFRREAKILQSVTDLVLTYDRGWRFTYLNDSAAASLGRNREELLGQCMWDLFPEMLSQPGFVLLKELGDLGLTGDYEAYNPHTEHWIEGTVYPTVDGLTVYCRNVTARKLAEMQVERQNTALRMLSDTNHALASIQDEQRLVAEVCRIAVEVGGYRLAWVGYPQNDEAHSILPIARHGVDDGYIEEVNLTWADRGIGSGPGGVAIRTGRPVVSNDLFSNPLTPDAAKQRDFRAMVALPLLDSEKTFGALYVYLATVDAFSNEEVEALTELAANLSRGIVAIRLSAQHAEAQLRVLKALAREVEVMDSITDDFVALDRDWRFIYVNKPGLATMGLPANEIIGMSVWDLYGELIGAESYTAMQKCMNERVPTEFLVYIPSEERWAEGRVYPTPEGVCLYSHTVTDRILAQRESARKDRLLQIIGVSGHALFRISDEAELLSEICRTLVDVGGYPLAWIGFAEQDDAKTISPKAMAGEYEGYVDRLNLTWDEFGVGVGPSGATIRTGVPVVVRDLESTPGVPEEAVKRGYACIAGLPLRSLTETIGGMCVFSRDPESFNQEEIDVLTELASDVSRAVFAIRLRRQKHHAEEQARIAQHQRIDTLESITDMFVAFDFEGRFTYVNERAAESRGLARDEMLGKLFADVYPELVDSNAHTETLRAMMEGRPTHFEFQNPISKRWYESDSYPSREGVTVYTREITARKMAEADRETLEAQLREAQKIEAIGTLAGGIAHDFNNILGTILGNVELAIEDSQGNAMALESLREIRSASERARDLTQQILYFGRRQSFEKKTVVLSLIVDQAVNLLRSTLPARIRITGTVSRPTIAVRGDATQLLQILVNLGTNAAHAIGDRPGNIDIAVDWLSIDDSASIGVIDVAQGDYARISVRDTGHGMDDATIERVFEPFFTTKGLGEGTGLGLSVVHGIVKSHDGKVAIHSALGKGTTFEIYLPLVDDDETKEGPASVERTTLPGKRVHVLCIDDDEQLGGLVSRVLNRHGYQVTCFLDGAGALEALRADPTRFDVVLTDLNMPGISGLELATEVHRLLPNMPVGIASGLVTEEIRSKALAVGVTELIHKPNAINEYVEAIQRLVK